MATVNEGKVVLFRAGGPVGASVIAALKGHYTLRVTDLRPMMEVAAAPPQGVIIKNALRERLERFNKYMKYLRSKRLFLIRLNY